MTRPSATASSTAEVIPLRPDAPTPPPEERRAFLHALLGAGPYHLVAIEPDGQLEGRSFASLDAAEAWLEANDGHSNLYTHINRLHGPPASGKAAKADIAVADFVAVDIDPPPAVVDVGKWQTRTIAELRAGPLKPTAITISGYGVQAFWRIAGGGYRIENAADRERIEAVNKALIGRFGGDRGTWSLDRIFRIPGTVNVPDAKKRQRGRERSRARVVDLEDVAHALTAIERGFQAGKAPKGRAKPNGAAGTHTAPPEAPGRDASALWGQAPGYIRALLEKPEKTDQSEEFHRVVTKLAACQVLRASVPEMVTLLCERWAYAGDRCIARYACSARGIEGYVRLSLAKMDDVPWWAETRHDLREQAERKGNGMDSGNAGAQAADIGHNSDAVPLLADVPPCAPFPVNSLGPVIGPAARALHDGVVQAPMPMCASSALGAAALSVQGIADLELPTGEVVPLSLFLLTIAKSGERKSSLDNRSLAGVRQRGDELEREWKKAIANHQTAKTAWEIAKNGIAAAARKGRMSKQEAEEELRSIGPEPEPPKLPFLTAEEPTIEALQRLAIHGQRSIGLFSAEAAAFLGGHSMSFEKRSGTMGTLNRLWDGGGVERHRVSEDAAVRRDVRLSLSLQIQPKHGDAVLTDRDAVDIGLVSRLLPTKPESAIGTRFARETDEQTCALLEFTTRSHRRLEMGAPANAETGEADIPAVTFDAEARAAFEMFNDQVERAMAEGGRYEHITGFAAKMPQHAARIAGVLALFEDGDCRTLTADHFQRGKEVVEFYASEHLRLQGVATVDADLAQAEDLLERIKRKWPDASFQVRDVLSLKVPGLRASRDAKRALATLTEHGLLRHEQRQGSTGRKSDFWRVADGC